VFVAVFRNPPCSSIRLFQGNRILCLGSPGEIHEYDRHAGATREIADQPIVGVAVAEHPPAAVKVEQGREAIRVMRGTDDTDRYAAGRAARDRQVFYICRKGYDVHRLCQSPEPPCFSRRQFVDLRPSRATERIQKTLRLPFHEHRDLLW
jgi:hypothetical protein